MERFQHTLPWRGGPRRPPAQASDRGRRKGDAEKMNDSAIRASRPKDSAALHLSLSGHRHVVALRFDCFQNAWVARETPVDFGNASMRSVTS